MSNWYFAVFAGWLLLAAVVSVWMGRRGHSSFGWAVVVGALGPFGVPIAVAAVRAERGVDTEPRVIAEGRAGAGPVDVLVGIDASKASEEALDHVAELLGDRIGELHLATVIDYDQGEMGGRSAAVDAQAELDAVAIAHPDLSPTLVVLVGKPADALADYAVQEGVDVIAVGTRGAGHTPKLLGSTAERLTRLASVPVLVGGRPGRERARRHAHAHEPVDVVTVAHALGAR